MHSRHEWPKECPELSADFLWLGAVHHDWRLRILLNDIHLRFSPIKDPVHLLVPAGEVIP